MASARPKAFLRKTTPKKKDQVLETADDFQAAGVDFEDAAGKWRKGDPVKSLRFFQRAIEVYEQGLQHHPRSLDLAYNKARVELEVATHPLLANQLQIPIIDALRQALASHKYALSLDERNPDTLFNSAQALTCIAEEIAKNDALSDSEATQYLEEALELQTLCSSVQELRYEEAQQQQQQLPSDDEDDDGGATLVPGNATTLEDSQEQTQWATIIEPVTIPTLIDTALAQLGTLTALCSLLSNSKGTQPRSSLAMIEELATRILQEKIPAYIRQLEASGEDTLPSDEDNNRDTILHEIALARAQFLTHLAESLYYAGNTDASTYITQRNQAFDASQNPNLNLTTSQASQLANARSLISLATALASPPSQPTQHQLEPSILAQHRWTTLSAALTSLASTSKLISTNQGAPAEQAETHALRGDVSLMLYRLSLPPVSFAKAVQGAEQLLKNASVYYRNAAKLYPSSASSDFGGKAGEDEEKKVAQFRADVVEIMMQVRAKGTTSDSGAAELGVVLEQLVRGSKTGSIDGWKKSQVDEMVDDGLIDVGI